MNYKSNSFEKHVGFTITTDNIVQAVDELNEFLTKLPVLLFKNIDFKTTGSLMGAVLCHQLAEKIGTAIVNPIEKGYPDLIPASAADSPEELLRNYPSGLEIKGTVGNLKQGIRLHGGQTRIHQLSGITWQAHHREGKLLLGFIWDFIHEHDHFLYPAITAVYFSDKLEESDWGSISGTTGRNTKVTGLRKSGLQKMGEGLILVLDEEIYKSKYAKYLYYDNH